MDYWSWGLTDGSGWTIEQARMCRASLSEPIYNNLVYVQDVVYSEYNRFHQIQLYTTAGIAPTSIKSPYNIYTLKTDKNDVTDSEKRIIAENIEVGGSTTDLVAVYKSNTDSHRIICSYDLSTNTSTEARTARSACADTGSIQNVGLTWSQGTNIIYVFAHKLNKVFKYFYLTGTLNSEGSSLTYSEVQDYTVSGSWVKGGFALYPPSKSLAFVLKNNTFMGIRLEDNSFSGINTPSLNGVDSSYKLETLETLGFSDNSLYLAVAMKTKHSSTNESYKYYLAMFKKAACSISKCNLCTQKLTQYPNAGVWDDERCLFCDSGYLGNSVSGSTSCTLSSASCVDNWDVTPRKLDEICTRCSNNCLKCGVSSCEACPSSAQLKNNEFECVSNCPTGKVASSDGTYCEKCHTSCKSCSSTLSTGCLTCKPNLKKVGSTCVSCESQCIECKESGCYSCVTGYVPVNKVCQAKVTCTDGQYWISSTNTCVNCPSFC